jgi:hypothetical protein
MYKYMKTSRLHITRYICGKPIRSIQGSGVSVTRGWPTKLLFLKELYFTDKGKRVILTLCNLTRGIEPTKKERESILPDFTSITEKSRGRTYVIPRFFLDVMKRKYRIDGKLIAPCSENLFLNMKSSPIGRVSIMSCVMHALLHTGKRLSPLLILLGEGS